VGLTIPHRKNNVVMICFVGFQTWKDSLGKAPKVGKFNIISCDNCRWANIRSNLHNTHFVHEFSQEKSPLLSYPKVYHLVNKSQPLSSFLHTGRNKRPDSQ
jgi:hypothetical protein